MILGEKEKKDAVKSSITCQEAYHSTLMSGHLQILNQRDVFSTGRRGSSHSYKDGFKRA